jgi:hypothetical protein
VDWLQQIHTSDFFLIFMEPMVFSALYSKSRHHVDSPEMFSYFEKIVKDHYQPIIKIKD